MGCETRPKRPQRPNNKKSVEKNIVPRVDIEDFGGVPFSVTINGAKITTVKNIEVVINDKKIKTIKLEFVANVNMRSF